MVFVTGTITVLSRLIGGIASSTLGWATLLLFGRVPQARQRLLDLMAMSAVGWLLCVVALVSPAFAHLIVSSVPRPGFVDLSWFGILILLGAVGLPAAVGAMTSVLAGDRDRHDPLAALGHLLRGYPLTLVLVGTILFLAGWSIARAVRTARLGWQSLHLPMYVKPRGYERVVSDVATALRTQGLVVEQTVAPPWFVVPPKLLALVGGLTVEGLVPDELVAFVGDDLRILVYPSDVALIGKTEHVVRARSAIVRALAFTEAYLTATKESEQVEDRLRKLATSDGGGSRDDYAAIDGILDALEVPHDDWLTLYRLRLEVEHEARGRSAPVLERRAS